MNKLRILNPARIKFAEMTSDLRGWLSREYAQRRSNFSTASPYGQILRVLTEFVQLVFLYIEDALTELNITTATKQRAVAGLARIAGHDPTRPLSAVGTVRLKLKPSARDEVNATYVTVPNGAVLTCENNGLKYFVELDNALEGLRVEMTDTQFRYARVVQGEQESQTVQGTGEPFQSFNLQARRPIAHELVRVRVNGEPYEVVESLYDMRKDEKLCMVRTGVAGGIDVFFGNEDYGTVPALGESITVDYVLTDGFAGNIFSRSSKVRFKFDDPGTTNNGDEADLNELFDVNVEKAMVLGADAEPLELTKLIAPKQSRSFVLANPDNYVALLSRFNFAHVDAYTTFDDEYIDDDNVVYLFLVPDVRRRLVRNTDYYTLDETALYLDPDEKERLRSYLHQSGRMVVSTELEIVDPILTRYALNVFLRTFDWADERDVRAEVISRVTDYMLTVKRRDKMPKSDLVAIIEAVDGVDSVNVSFVSEANEKAIIDGFYTKRVETVDRVRGLRTYAETRVKLAAGEDPNLGLDDFGDVKIGLNELPVLRGGWYDRYGNYYENGLDGERLSPVNVVVKETVADTLANRISASNKANIG